MAARQELPKLGDIIPAELLHVSRMNVRYGVPFDPEKKLRDRLLVESVRAGGVKQCFEARPEKNPETGKDGYGVYVGKRRYQAKEYLGTKRYKVGEDLLVKNVLDEEARQASFVEGDDTLREEVDPMTRAIILNEMVSDNPAGLRATARELGKKPSTLAEWRKLVELSPKMQGVVRRRLLAYSNALQLTRLKLSMMKQDELAEIIESEGVEAYLKELARFQAKQKKRGPPTDKFETIKTMWDKRDNEDMEPYKVIAEAAEAKKMKVPEYIKDFLKRHLDEIKREIS